MKRKVFRRTLLSALILSWLVSGCLAQNIMHLHKYGSHRHLVFQQGDNISIVTGGKEISGRLSYIDSARFILDNGEMVMLKKVESVNTERYIPRLISSLGFTAAAFYTPIAVINRSINEEYPILDGTSLTVIGTSAGIGGLFYLFIKHKLRMKNGWRLDIIDIEPGPGSG